jgi:D-xylose 1-dehydrogenase (NADP+, D-xylono-1,5-lactone-forming)
MREEAMPANDARVRWGILGVAKINERLLPGFARAKYADLHAIASRSMNRAESAAAVARIPKAYGSYEQLLGDPGVDALYIPLPNSLHAEWTKRAAERGKHILCEKPLAPTANAARDVIDFCRANGVKLMDGFMWPHHPRTARLRQLLDSGGIGEIRRVNAAFTFRLDPLATSNIRLQPDLGGGSLLDIGCYPVFGIRWVFGAEPVQVFANAVFKHGVDVEMSGQLRFEDGRMASFDCGFTSSFRGWLEITGTEGTIVVPEMWLPPRQAMFQIHREGRAPEKVVIEGEDQIVHMIDNFSLAVLEDREVVSAPDEAVLTLKVMDALAGSAKEGIARSVR